MSGLSNVSYWLESRRLPKDEELVQAIYQKAKSSNRVLTEEEIMAIVRARRGREASVDAHNRYAWPTLAARVAEVYDVARADHRAAA